MSGLWRMGGEVRVFLKNLFTFLVPRELGQFLEQLNDGLGLLGQFGKEAGDGG